VFIPTVIPISTAAASPRGKKKYTRMNVDLAIDRSIFKQPDSIHMLVNKTLEISVVMAIPKHHFNDEGLNHYDSAISNMDTQLDKHPELKSLLDEFLPKWKAAFDKAVEVEASEKNDQNLI
jgi:hypothetical protein